MVKRDLEKRKKCIGDSLTGPPAWSRRTSNVTLPPLIQAFAHRDTVLGTKVGFASV